MQDPLQVLRLRKALDVTQPPYVTRYPKLANTFDPSPDVRRRNEVCDNAFVQSEGPQVASGDEVTDNLITREDPGFVDAAAMNFQLKPDSIVSTKISRFQKIPFEKIGPYQDEYRKAVPLRPADRSTALRPPVRDPKTRQFAASLNHLESETELSGQGGWAAFAMRPSVALGQGLVTSHFDPGTAAMAAGADTWAAVWHGVVLDPAKDIVLQMDACLPSPLSGKSFFELYLNRGQVVDNGAFGVALVGGAQDTGRSDTVGVRRSGAGPRAVANEHLVPGHWYRLQLLIPAGARQGRLLARDLTAGEAEPHPFHFADAASGVALGSGDTWSPPLSELDALLLRLGGDAQATNIVLRNSEAVLK
jgi:hypothetical protein